MANINPQQQKRTGTGFTNLQRLMQANVGNRLGQAVGQGIQKTGQIAKNQLGEAEQRFSTEAEKGRLGTDTERQRVENVLGAPEAATEQDISEFGRFRAGAFTGPRGLQDVETIRGQAREAEQLGRSIGSTGGRQGLLQRFAAGPGQYGAGAQKLDTLLLGSGPNTQQLKEASRSVRGLGGQTDVRAQAASEVAKQYENQARGFGQEVTQRTGALEGQALTAAQQKAQQAMEADTNIRDQAEAARQGAASNQLNQQALEALGLQAGQRTYGAQLGEFLGYQGRGAGDVVRPEETMTPQEFQRFSNLRRLMGGDTQEFDPTKVGQYQAGQQTFNKEGAQQALQQAESQITPLRQRFARAAQAERLFLSGYDPQRHPYSPDDVAEAQRMGIPVQHLISYKFPGMSRQQAAQEFSSSQRDLNELDARLSGQIELLPEVDPNLENMPKVT